MNIYLDEYINSQRQVNKWAGTTNVILLYFKYGINIVSLINSPGHASFDTNAMWINVCCQELILPLNYYIVHIYFIPASKLIFNVLINLKKLNITI